MNPIFKKYFSILLLNCLAISSAYAQKDSLFQYAGSINGEFTYFNVDNLDNVYLLTKGNQLKKWAANGDSIGVFNDVKRYGNVEYIDVNNPLKVLLYYKNYSTVVMLDRLLGFRNSINFRNRNIFNVNAISTSYDNNIWLFDEQEYKLRKIDETGKLLSESIDWRQLFDSIPSPTKIIDRDGFVYVYDPAKGFYIFDYYGTYKNRMHFTGWTDVAVNNGKIYGFKGDVLYSYQLNSFNLKEYKLPKFMSDRTAIRIMNGKIYISRADRIDMYEVK